MQSENESTPKSDQEIKFKEMNYLKEWNRRNQ
jgi:hypothetical protein